MLWAYHGTFIGYSPPYENPIKSKYWNVGPRNFEMKININKCRHLSYFSNNSNCRENYCNVDLRGIFFFNNNNVETKINQNKSRHQIINLSFCPSRFYAWWHDIAIGRGNQYPMIYFVAKVQKKKYIYVFRSLLNKVYYSMKTMS